MWCFVVWYKHTAVSEERVATFCWVERRWIQQVSSERQ